MNIIFRLILLLAPLVLVFMWLRWRKRYLSEDVIKEETDRLTFWTAMLAGLMLLAGLGLYFTDDARAPAGQRYVPPHMKDGELVPGKFVPEQSEAAPETPERPEAPETSGTPHSSPASDAATNADETGHDGDR